MHIKSFLAAAMTTALVGMPSFAQQPAGSPMRTGAAVVPADQVAADLEAIRESAEAFASAFNARDARAVASLWTPDGQYIDESGQTYAGREAIGRLYADFFARNPNVRIRVIVDSARVLADGTAIEEGRTVVEPPPAGAPAVGKYTAEHVRVGGKWLMARVHDLRVETPSAYRGLADLEFLIGTWNAEELGIKTESTCRWVGNKSFVERRYTVTNRDGTTLSGVQIIGWNPATGSIQSWDFAPDGGHATGVWSPIADGWSAEVQGVSSSGTPTAAVNTLRRLDDNAYVWQSVNRSAGGVVLPDTDEVVIKRGKTAQ